MKKYLLNFRNQEIYSLWERLKGRVTMEEIAKIFNLPLKTAYRIIRQESLSKGRLIKK